MKPYRHDQFSNDDSNPMYISQLKNNVSIARCQTPAHPDRRPRKTVNDSNKRGIGFYLSSSKQISQIVTDDRPSSTTPEQQPADHNMDDNGINVSQISY